MKNNKNELIRMLACQAYGLPATEFLGNRNKMSIINMVKNIKEIQSKTILLLKVGAFCESYGKDSYILSYLLGYEIKEVKDGIYKVGFSKKAIKKVIAKLEEEKIDFLLNLSYDKEIINQKQYYKFGTKMDDITKYACGWLKSLDV